MQSNQLKEIITLFKKQGFKSAKILVSVIFIIIVIGNVSLYQIAVNLEGHGTKHDSKERAIRRLLDKTICPKIYAQLIDKLLNFSKMSNLELIMDRTNWKLGRVSINLFVLSINWNNLAIPIYWVFLDNKGGNSKSSDRQDLIKWYIKEYGNNNIFNIYADREFPSIEFIDYLLDKSVNFIFRIKDNIKVGDGDKQNYMKKPLNQLFKDLANGHYKAELKIRKILDNRLYISAKRNNNNELMVLISNKFHKDPFELYAHRWNIETMFNKLKTSGFNLENTHITNPQRIITLFTVVSIAYAYCCYIGNFRNTIKPIKQKIIKAKNIPAMSVFRCGFNLIKHIVISWSLKRKKLFTQLINFILHNKMHPNSKLFTLITNF